MRPSGRLHLGNWLGALQNWVALQDDYECIYSIVDVHALTTLTDGHEAGEIAASVNEIARVVRSVATVTEAGDVTGASPSASAVCVPV